MSDLILDYMLMSGNAYDSTRSSTNKIPVPLGWNQLPGTLGYQQPKTSGFEAAAYQQGNQIVISFAGTFPGGSLFPADLVADGTLGYGACHDQLKDAALYYMQIKAANPNADIVFTGHSLGGGLAALMGCFFGRHAFTFDQAPLRRAATEANRDALVTYLQGQGYSTDTLFELTSFYSSRLEIEVPGLNPVYVTSIRGEANVKDWHVKGEFLTESPNGTLSMDAWLLGVTRIGESTQIEQGAGFNLPVLKIGNQISSVDDAHAIELAIALRASPTFGSLTYDIPYFLAELFDESLFANEGGSAVPNLLTHLIRHQFGGNGVTADGMLDKFVADAARLSVGGYPMTNEKLGRGLLEVAMQYYWQTTGEVTSPLFDDATGGFTFDIGKLTAGDNAIKGMAWLGSSIREISGDNGLDPRDYHVWHVAVSNVSGASLVGAGGTSDILIGGAFDDTLEGGGGTDLLIGGSGNDVLDGRDGESDLLIGGTGFDTYHADEGDTIRDSDGKGTVILNGKTLTLATRHKGETAYQDADGNIYILTGTSLLVNDPLVIENFTSGDFGIELKEELDPDDPDDPALKDAFKKAEVTRSPLVLDLDGNGISTRGIGQGAFFDFDGNGFAERTGWITGGDALLVRDLDANGTIDSGGELFGNHTRLKNGSLAGNGYTALADLDDTHDGQVDSQDAAWTELKVWQDANSDGLTQAGELKTLDQAGIQSIATVYTAIAATDSHGNQHLQQGSFTKSDGSTGQTEDLWFRTNNASTRQVNPLELSTDTRALPEIKGMGNVASLKQVMAQQAVDGGTQLKDLIEQFAAEPDLVARQALTLQIIYVWTGVEDKDPLSRANRAYGNVIGDARKLYAMEALLGEGYEGIWCWNEKDPNPHGPAAAVLLKAFDQYAGGITAQLMQQTRLKDLYGGIRYTWDAGTQSVMADLSGTIPLFADKLAADREQGKTAIAQFITNLLVTHKVTELDTRSFQEGLAALGQDVLDVATLAWRGLIATQGNDQLTGDGTNEVIAGWGGNDFIQSGGGNDTLRGEQGDDRLYGQDGSDTLEGGAGNDLLDGGTGNDIYLFGRGDGEDTIWSQDATAGKRDTLKVGAGITANDVDLIRNVDDLILTLRDSGERVTVAGYFTNDGGSASSLEAVEFADGMTWDFAAVKAMLPAMGTAGDDRIRGYDTTEVIDGLGGNDVIEGQGGDDALMGNTGDDALYGKEGDDTLDGGIGNDALDGGAGDDTYLFGREDGHDTIASNDANQTKQDAIQFKEGVASADVEVSRYGDHLILSIAGTAGQLTVRHYFSYDGSFNPYGVESIRFADNTSWDYAAVKAKSLEATAGNDRLIGFNAAEEIDGLGGDDVIDGCGGNDILMGGIGNDALDGGAGDDTYLFGRGDGEDTIAGYDANQTKQDAIQFKEGVAPADVFVSRYGDHLILKIAGTADQLTVQYYFSYEGSFNPYGVESIRFADDTSWDYAAVKAKSLEATAGNDWLVGSTGDEILSGLGGDDHIEGRTGNDLLDGGAGNDALDGGAGDDTYLFGRGDGQDMIASYDANQTKQDAIQFKEGVAPADVVVSRYGDHLILKIAGTSDQLTVQYFFSYEGSFNPYSVESIRFADNTSWDYAAVKAKSLEATAGNDWLVGSTGDEILSGLGGDDHIEGRTGNDLLDGGAGNDALDGGAGDDIYLFGRGDGQDTISSYEANQTKQDAIQFKDGIAQADVVVSRYGDNLILKIGGTPDQLTVRYFFSYEGSFNPYSVESIRFADNTSWDYGAIKAKSLEATAGNDWLVGSTSDDSLNGLGGDDRLEGRTGNDTLEGGTGNDALYGYEGNDALNGGTGSDALDGGVGNDIYLFGSGSGWDSISDYDTTVGNIDTVILAEGVSPSNVEVTRDQFNLYLSLNGGADRLSLSYWLSADAYKIERVAFADGTVWTQAELLALLPSPSEADNVLWGTTGDDDIDGLGGNDTLFGVGGNDTLVGGAGNDALHGGTGNDIISGVEGDDTLFGEDGNDTLDGGAGNDALDGGAGNDTYVFGPGSGQDSIYDNDTTVGNIDTVRLADGVVPGDVTLTHDLYNLYLNLNGGTDRLTLSNWFGGIASKIERVAFSDGTEWTATDLVARMFASSNADDVLSGTVDDDTINGLGGNDTLVGEAGNDTLDGGAGNDSLQGGTGNDTYLFGRGDGQDTISSYDGSQTKQDAIQFKTDVAPTDLVVSWYGDNLILKIAGTTDQLTIQNYFSNGGTFNPYGIEAIQFSDGSPAWRYADVKAKLPGATEGNDQLYGFSGVDLISGLGGNDTINGGRGNDTLDGGVGNDLVYGEDGDDWLIGGAGDDSLSGHSGNDVLDGGSGNDRLYGANGNDTYRFGIGDGQDSVSNMDWDSNKRDVVQFKDGIAPTDVSVSRQGGHLVLKIGDSQDQLTVDSYFYNDGAFNPYGGIEAIEFADGTVWDYAAVTAKLPAATTGNDVLYGTGAVDALDGLAGDDVIYGLAGDDAIIGGAGDDLLVGGYGRDVYVFNRGDGVDTIDDALSYAYNGGYGGAWGGGTGNELHFGEGISPDQIAVTNSDGTLVLSVTGTADSVRLLHWVGGVDRVDRIVFADGTVLDANRLELLLSVNIAPEVQIPIGQVDATEGEPIAFGIPEGTFYDANPFDVLTLSVQLENGDPLPSWLSFDPSTKVLAGTPGSDAAGNLRLLVTAEDVRGATASDVFDLDVANRIVGTDAPNSLVGTALHDVIEGLAGNDTLDGGKGADILIGGAGDDTYAVDNVGDVVTEYANEGVDLVQSSVSYTLAANVENLTLTKTAAIAATGNALDNVLTGNSGKNTLTGGAGNDTLDGGNGSDTLIGGQGNDIYVVNSAGDIVIENANEGSDTVNSKVSYALGSDLENLTLTGTAAIKGTGNTLDNVIMGNSGNNILDGGAGIDILAGGGGKDIYIVDTATDTIAENAGEGTDTVQSSASYTLGENLENLTLTGTAAINGMGNELNNVIKGNGGDNILDGGDGIDTLIGGAGNDTYLVDSATDDLTEAARAGTDTVQSSVTYALGANLENLTLTGVDAVKGTGNTLGNIITGNSADNVLDGGKGADTLIGGAGDDTYVVDNVDDAVTENANEGVDLVQSSVSYTLAANVENLTLTKTAAIAGTGNALDNVLTGNRGKNTLTGNAGNDALDGMSGSDTLIGGMGDDLYLFGTGYGSDSIRENDATSGNADVAQFLEGISADQIWLRHVSNNLEASIIGTTDKLIVEDWYLGSSYHVEQFKTADGKLLLDSQVENLVQAMAAFAPPAAGQTTLPPTYQDSLAPVIAANWQ
ncbi:MAG: calcium-binding protein [Pseudomonadota bacterium]